MTKTTELTHRQTISVRVPRNGSSETEVVEVIFLQHSSRMPGFMQCDRDGAIVYISADALVVEDKTVKVTRAGVVYVGKRSVGKVYQESPWLVSPGGDKWRAKNRGGEITRHRTRKDAVAKLTASWIR